METALQQLIKKIDSLIRDEINHGGDYELPFNIIKEQAKLLLKDDKIQHGDTWDAAIKSYEQRGHVMVRAWEDFDDYFENRFDKNIN